MPCTRANKRQPLPYIRVMKALMQLEHCVQGQHGAGGEVVGGSMPAAEAAREMLDAVDAAAAEAGPEPHEAAPRGPTA
jgi:hypothetical protein